MQCSHCDAPLTKKKLNALEIHICDRCKALWLGSKDIIPTMNYFIEHPDTVKSLEESPVKPEEITEGYCADCNEMAKPIQLNNPKFKFLKCVGCNGIWADHNNLKNMVTWWDKNKNKRDRFIFPEKEKEDIIKPESYGKSFFGWMSDDNPLNHFPTATVILIILNIIGFFVLDINADPDNKIYMFTPSLFLANPGKEIITVFTSMFMHGSPEHIFGNMIFLFMFGNNVEDRIGKIKFILFYLFIGAAATIIFAFISVQKDIPSLGASGAISGILGAYMFLYPKVNIKQYRTFFFMPYSFNIPAWVYLGVWFVGQQLFGIAANIPGIGWVEHLTGFVLGYIIMFAMKEMDFL